MKCSSIVIQCLPFLCRCDDIFCSACSKTSLSSVILVVSLMIVILWSSMFYLFSKAFIQWTLSILLSLSINSVFINQRYKGLWLYNMHIMPNTAIGMYKHLWILKPLFLSHECFIQIIFFVFCHFDCCGQLGLIGYV